MKRLNLLLISSFLIFTLSCCAPQPESFPSLNVDTDRAVTTELILSNRLRFEHLSVDDGLPHATVLSVLQDSQGFMWFATGDGLARYDGYDFTIFRHDQDDPSSLSHNNLFCLEETSDGLLWIGTDNGGVNVYNPSTGKFTAYQNNPDDPNSLVNNSVWALYEDSQGVLWIGTRGGLSRLDRSTDTFTNYVANPEDPHSLADDIVYRIYEDASGTIWLGTRSGLNRYNPDTDDFTVYQNNPNDPTSLSSNRVWSMLEDSHGNFWVGTRSGGLNLFDPETGKFRLASGSVNDTLDLSTETIWSIYEDHTKNLWLATEHNGLVYYNPSTGTFTAYRNNPNNPLSLSHNDVFWITEDRSGVLWIASRYNGVNKLVPALQRFTLYRHIPEDDSTLSTNNVFSIYKQDNRYLWIGTSGGGLNRLDRTTNQMTVFTNDVNDPESISNNQIYDIVEDEDGSLWIATAGGGLNHLDTSTGKFTAYQRDEEDPLTLGSNFLTILLPSEGNQLWVGTLGYGLELFDTSSGEVTKRYKHDATNENSLSEDTIYDLQMDSKGKIWIATGRGGVEWFNPQTETFTHYRYQKGVEDSLANDTVQCLYLDESNNTLWAGTIEGLSSLEITTGVWKTYTTEDGLASSNINGIQPGGDGSLWLSTSKGIIRLDQSTGAVKNYDVQDGLQGNQFNLFSSFSASDGELFFGGPNGLTSFYAAQITDNDYLPPVVLTDFSLYNQSVPVGNILPEPVNQVTNLTLDHTQSVFTFEFAALNYQVSAHNMYQHQLVGFESDWSPPNTKRTITYTNLDPGTYTFMVRASNNDGVWSKQATSLTITILPPWWETWWARTLAVAVASATIMIIFQLRINNTRRLNRQLERRVADRTSELTQVNLNLAKEVERREVIEKQLLEMNNQLQTQLDEIKILRDNLREQAIRDDLTGLFNRRYLWETLERELAHAQRIHTPLSILMIDIDHFKLFNDHYNHAAGDAVLRSLGEIMMSNTRRSDITCRYGGEEFVIIMQDASQEDTLHRANEIHQIIQNTPIFWNSHKFNITVSIGIATYPTHGDDFDLLLQKADQALYQAKNKGRNRVVLYTEETLRVVDRKRLQDLLDNPTTHDQ